MTTKLVEINCEEKQAVLTCAICDSLVWMRFNEFIAEVNKIQDSEDLTGLFIVCEACSRLSPEEWGRKRRRLERPE